MSAASLRLRKTLAVRNPIERQVAVFEQLDALPPPSTLEALSTHYTELAVAVAGAAAGRLLIADHEVLVVGDYAGNESELKKTLAILVDEHEHGRLELVPGAQPWPSDVDALLALVARRWAREWQQVEQLVAARERELRLEALLDIAGLMSSTLDRERLLQQILTYACLLLHAEAASIFIVDEETGDLVLRVATGPTAQQIQNLRVPKGKGIAGHVAETGETAVVNDLRHDTRFYDQADRTTNFHTHSMVCVPLRSRGIQMGETQGNTAARIVGVAQVLNRLDNQAFSAEDVTLFATLCSQAATVMEVAGLYANMQELFTDVIEAITAAIDAKDEYTEGHSRRVSQYSTEIARELGLAADFVWQVQISGILHDVGKIGVPDAVLKKPGPLSDEEFAAMKRHPEIGARIMSTVRLLKPELPGLFEHHERLDGRGYPRGLQGDEISLMGRIIAVADSFDAMTSDRAYRKGLGLDEALRRINDGAGTQWDAECVAALRRALAAGTIALTHGAHALPEAGRLIAA